MVKLWKKDFERLELLNALQNSLPAETMLQSIELSLTSEEGKKVSLTEEDEGLRVKVLLDGARSWNCVLPLASPQEFYQNVTLPLVLMVSELSRRQTRLMELLERKDEELSEYRMDGATLTRRHIVTQEFDRDRFLRECEEPGRREATSTAANLPSIILQPSFTQLYSSLSLPLQLKKENGLEEKEAERGREGKRPAVVVPKFDGGPMKLAPRVKKSKQLL